MNPVRGLKLYLNSFFEKKDSSNSSKMKKSFPKRESEIKKIAQSTVQTSPQSPKPAPTDRSCTTAVQSISEEKDPSQPDVSQHLKKTLKRMKHYLAQQDPVSPKVIKNQGFDDETVIYDNLEKIRILGADDPIDCFCADDRRNVVLPFLAKSSDEKFLIYSKIYTFGSTGRN